MEESIRIGVIYVFSDVFKRIFGRPSSSSSSSSLIKVWRGFATRALKFLDDNDNDEDRREKLARVVNLWEKNGFVLLPSEETRVDVVSIHSLDNDGEEKAGDAKAGDGAKERTEAPAMLAARPSASSSSSSSSASSSSSSSSSGCSAAVAVQKRTVTFDTSPYILVFARGVKVSRMKGEVETFLLNFCKDNPRPDFEGRRTLIQMERPRALRGTHVPQLSTSNDVHVGLENFGWTCYINTIVQCLGTLPQLKEWAMTQQCSPDAANPATAALRDTMVHLQGGEPDWDLESAVAALSHIQRLAAFGDSGQDDDMQHDCQEFLVALLDAMHEEEIKRNPIQTE